MWVPIFSHTIVVVSFPGMDFYEPLHFLKLCWKENYSVLPGSLRTTYYSIADSSLVPYVHVKFIIRTTITYVQDRDDDPVVCPCVARVEGCASVSSEFANVSYTRSYPPDFYFFRWRVCVSRAQFLRERILSFEWILWSTNVRYEKNFRVVQLFNH